jgi:hypothetical protein
MDERPYISYPFLSPRMNQSVPPNQVQVGSFDEPMYGIRLRFACVSPVFHLDFTCSSPTLNRH